MEDILTNFRRLSKGLNFTCELANDSCLQFLDLKITLKDAGFCWKYQPRAQKKLLPFDSKQSKTVKRAIALMCLESSLRKSCCHMAQESFHDQVAKLKQAGFPQIVVSSVAEALLKKIKQERSRNQTMVAVAKKKVKPVVIPYQHKVAHNLKRVANKFKVPVVFSAPRKLSSLCRLVSQDGSRNSDCKIKHVNKFVKCEKGVVYRIPLKCGKVYIGQSGRCVNERLREHSLSLKNGTGSHLPAHISECGKDNDIKQKAKKLCDATLQGTSILCRSTDTLARELAEAYHIRKSGSSCVSAPSVTIYDKDFAFLDKLHMR